MKLVLVASFVISLIIMFSSITSLWIMYLRYKRTWMKQYVVYALVWAVGIIQTGFLFLSGIIDKPDNQNSFLLLLISILFGLLFIFMHIAPPFLLFNFAGIKVNKPLKFAIILNPLMLPLYLALALFYASFTELGVDPDVILRIAVSILISLAGIVSLIFQTAALTKILKGKNLERGFILFIFLICIYQIIAIIFSARPIPGRISLGVYGYHLTSIFITSLAYLEFLIFIIKKLSRDFSGKKREISSEAVKEFNLTLRETDIANLLLIGLNSREIGEKLFITKKTVDTHIYNMYKKCGVKNKLEFFNLTG